MKAVDSHRHSLEPLFDMIDAVDILEDEFDLTFIIVGDGSQRNSLEARAEKRLDIPKYTFQIRSLKTWCQSISIRPTCL